MLDFCTKYIYLDSIKKLLWLLQLKYKIPIENVLNFGPNLGQCV